MAIEIKQQQKNNSAIWIILIIIILGAIGYFIVKDFLKLDSFIKSPQAEEVLPSKISVNINTAQLDIDKITNNSVFQSLISHIQWPLPSVSLGKNNIFKP